MRVVHADQELAAWHLPGSGRRVLLVHGWTGVAADLASIAQSLADQGHDVVLFDAPGCGRSTGVRGSLLDYSAAISRIDEVMGPFDAVVAHGTAATAALRALGPTGARAWALLAPSDPPVVVAGWCMHLGGRKGASLWGAVERIVREQLSLGPTALTLGAAARAAGGTLLVAHATGDRSAPFEHGLGLARSWPGSRLLEVASLDEDLPELPDEHLALLDDPRVHQAIVEHVGEM